MTTYNTKDPLGSASVKNLYDNSENLDKATNDRSSEVWEDRFGVERVSWYGMEMQNTRLIEKLNNDMQKAILAAGYAPIGTFQGGAEVKNINEVVLWRAPDGDGEYYRCDGPLPNLVPPNSTPETSGGIKTEDNPNGVWVGVGDAVLRSDLRKDDGANRINFDPEVEFDAGTVGGHLKKVVINTAQVFSLDSEGAKGNGIDSDDEAFERVIAKIKKHGGGIMHMTPGKTYRTTYTHLFPSNYIMSGHGSKHFFDLKADGSAWLPETFQSGGQFVDNSIFEGFEIISPRDKGNYIGTPGARNVLLDGLLSDYIHWHLIDGCNGKNVQVTRCKVKARSAVVQIESITHKKAVWGIDKKGNEIYPDFLADNSAYWSYTDTWHVHNNDFDSIDGSSGVGVNLHGGVTMARVFIHNNFFNSLATAVLIDGGEKRYTTISNNNFVNCNRSISSSGDMLGYLIESNMIYNATAGGNYNHIIHQPDISKYNNLSEVPRSSIAVRGNQFVGGGKTPITFMHVNGTLDISNNRLSSYNSGYYTKDDIPLPNGAAGGISFAQIRCIECNTVSIDGNKTNNVSTNAFISLYNSEFSGTGLGSVFHEVRNNSTAYGGILLIASAVDGTIVTKDNYSHGAGSGSKYHIVIDGYTDANIGNNDLRIRLSDSIPVYIKNAKGVVRVNGNSLNSNSAYGTAMIFDNCPNVLTDNNAVTGFGGAGALHIKAINGTNIKSFEPFMESSRVTADASSTRKFATINYS